MIETYTTTRTFIYIGDLSFYTDALFELHGRITGRLASAEMRWPISAYVFGQR